MNPSAPTPDTSVEPDGEPDDALFETDPTCIEDLGRLLAALYAKLRKLRVAVDQDREARERDRRLQRLAMFAAVLAGLTLFAGIVVALVQNAEDRDQQEQADRQQEQLELVVRDLAAASNQRFVDQCLSSNVARQSSIEGVTAVAEALIGSSAATTRTPDQQALVDERIAAFRRDVANGLAGLAPRDCSPEALGLPDVPPLPE